MIRLLQVLLMAAALTLSSAAISAAYAHPEDEFCGADADLDPALCRQLAELDSSQAEPIHPLMGDDGNALSGPEAAAYFFEVGVEHILPGGTDHILFVLALFLASPRLRDLVAQISTFTVAHTATLGLTAAAVIEPPASLVEPLIALSIAFVALERLLFSGVRRWRYLIVFGFGLFHGMGFAGFVREVGLPEEQFWPSLIGFNIGVEAGQIAVVAAAACLSLLARRTGLSEGSYERFVVRPGAILIAAVGTWWFLTRSLEGLAS